MIHLSRKTAAWASGAALAVGGCTAGIVIATQGGGSRGAHPAGTGANSRPGAARPVPLRLVSVTPGNGELAVDGARSITVTYNKPLPAAAPLPVLSPAIAGTWRRAGDAAVFMPARGYPAGTHVTVTVSGLGVLDAGTSAGAGTRTGAGTSAGSGARTGAGRGSGRGTRADRATRAGTGTRAGTEKSTFETGTYSTLRLQQILAQLGYLPMSWTPGAGAAVPAGSAAAQLAAAYAPPPGTFSWQHGYPSGLYSFWAQGKENTLDRGAITGFEADHELPTDGVAGKTVWKALLAAAARNERNTHGYSYAIASQSEPQRLTIWHDGHVVFSSLANLGISIDPTPVGTFPVYEKLPFQVMQGTNPDGSHYADPVSWVSYFTGGSAVHYIPRGSYGYPQSLGCVELPYDAAKQAYPYLPYGTLVTVT